MKKVEDAKADESVQFQIRAPLSLIKRVDAWRIKQDDIPGRAEAIRRLLAEALAPKRMPK